MGEGPECFRFTHACPYVIQYVGLAPMNGSVSNPVKRPDASPIQGCFPLPTARCLYALFVPCNALLGAVLKSRLSWFQETKAKSRNSHRKNWIGRMGHALAVTPTPVRTTPTCIHTHTWKGSKDSHSDCMGRIHKLPVQPCRLNLCFNNPNCSMASSD